MTRVHGPTVSCGTGVAQDEEVSPPSWLVATEFRASLGMKTPGFRAGVGTVPGPRGAITLRVGFGSNCLEWTPHSGSRPMPTRAANFSRKCLEPLGAGEGSLDQGFAERREHLVKEAGRPSLGQRSPFMRTKNCRAPNGLRKRRTLRFLLRE